MYTHVYVYVYDCMCMCMRMCMCMYNVYIYIHIYIYMYVDMCGTKKNDGKKNNRVCPGYCGRLLQKLWQRHAKLGLAGLIQDQNSTVVTLQINWLI